MKDIELIKLLVEVIEDFMPNIGKCALQDYGRLNTALIEADIRLCFGNGEIPEDDHSDEESRESIERRENQVLDQQEHDYNKREGQ